MLNMLFRSWKRKKNDALYDQNEKATGWGEEVKSLKKLVAVDSIAKSNLEVDLEES